MLKIKLDCEIDSHISLCCLHGRKKLEEIRICSLRACSFYYGGIANLRKRIRHQMKTCLSLRRINSAACGNHREPRGCCGVINSFTFCFTTRFLQNATEESCRNKAIQACLPSCNSVQYFLQISLKSSGFFLFEKKYPETCVCENRIHKIQTSTGLYKSISVCLMTKRIFQIILSSVKF